MLYYERCAKKNGYSIIVGVDEAGRGPLAGPVVAAAAWLKTFRFCQRINDSKKLTQRQRWQSFLELQEKSLFDVGILNEGAVDHLNIAQAANAAVDIAVHRLLRRLKRPKPTTKNTILLLDGKLKPGLGYPYKVIIGGDGLSLSIAAASIVAKVVRDRLMELYGRIYRGYGFDRHKGYGTRLHMERIARYGLSPIHRRTFCDGLSVKNR